jgi:hypothetical protein
VAALMKIVGNKQKWKTGEHEINNATGNHK